MARLLQARAETDAILRIVTPEAIYDRPIAERHRIIFYHGHLEAFDWNLLSGRFNLKSPNPELDRLFAFGIDPVDGHLPADKPEDWPRPERVSEYRDRARTMLDTVLESVPNPGLLLNVAIEHRLMHAETLAYMFHQMPYSRKTSRAVQRVIKGGSLSPETVRVPAGPAMLGLRRDSGVFGWCNEFEEQSVHVPEFGIDRHKVTNGQFLQFLEENGYENRALWPDANWAWKSAQGISHPAFWVRRGGGWAYRSMFDEIALPLDWPVYVSHAEASAYARWQGKALPSEAQWQRAAQGAARPMNDPTSDVWDPVPLNAMAVEASEFGVEGLFASGWEWTSTEFAPFPGFRP
jgi:hypothetical protein